MTARLEPGDRRLVQARPGFVMAAIIILLAAPASSLRPQDRVRQQRAELERIRQERADLERQMSELRSTAHDLSEEVTNLDRRADATARLVSTLDRQLFAIAAEVTGASHSMARAEEELSQKRVVLRRRLVDIYKRGPMYTAEALLSAASFGELVARYKYLHLLALRDRALVGRVEQLRSQVALERDRLVVLQRNLGENRQDKQVEEDRLRALEQQQRSQLSRVREVTRRTQNRIARMKATETQLDDAIATLEADRRRAMASTRRSTLAPRATSSVRTSDYGKLDWPVSGPLVYTFGRAVQPNNTTIRWNGVGIRAPVGTTVRQRRGRPRGQRPPVRHVRTHRDRRARRRRLLDLRIALARRRATGRRRHQGTGPRRRRHLRPGVAATSPLRGPAGRPRDRPREMAAPAAVSRRSRRLHSPADHICFVA